MSYHKYATFVIFHVQLAPSMPHIAQVAQYHALWLMGHVFVVQGTML